MTAGNQAAMTAEEWLLGVNRGPTAAQPHPPPSTLDMNDNQRSYWTCPAGPVLMSLEPGTANPYPESSADEEQLSFMKIQMDPPAATLKEVDLPGKVGPPLWVPPFIGDSSI